MPNKRTGSIHHNLIGDDQLGIPKDVLGQPIGKDAKRLWIAIDPLKVIQEPLLFLKHENIRS